MDVWGTGAKVSARQTRAYLPTVLRLICPALSFFSSFPFPSFPILFTFFFLFMVLGLEPRALSKPCKLFTTELHPWPRTPSRCLANPGACGWECRFQAFGQTLRSTRDSIMCLAQVSAVPCRSHVSLFPSCSCCDFPKHCSETNSGLAMTCSLSQADRRPFKSPPTI